MTLSPFAAEVAAIKHTLDVDDAFNEGRRRDNTAAATQLARRHLPTATHRLVVRWPIEHQDVSLAELRREATDDLTHMATTHGWTYTAPPLWHVRHGLDPHLEATIPVHAPTTKENAA